MFLQLLAMDCSLFIKKGCYQHIFHVLSDLSPHWVQEQWRTTAPDTLSAIISHAYGHVPASHPHNSSVEWFVSNVTLSGMCLFLLFLQNWMSIPHWKNILRQNNLRKVNFQCFQTVEGGVWIEHNIIQGVRETAGDHPDTPLHLNILQCVMLPENSLLKMSCFSAMCVTHLACEKAACLSIVCFLCIYVSIWSLFL